MSEPIVFEESPDDTQLNADWLGSIRLYKKAQAGDKEAAAELRRRERNKRVEMSPEEIKALDFSGFMTTEKG